MQAGIYLCNFAIDKTCELWYNDKTCRIDQRRHEKS